MISEIAIIEVNKLIGLCDSYLMTQSEIDYLNQIGNAPVSICEYYDTTKIVFDRRVVTDSTINAALDMLAALSQLDGCTIELDPVLIPDVDIPIFAGAL